MHFSKTELRDTDRRKRREYKKSKKRTISKRRRVKRASRPDGLTE